MGRTSVPLLGFTGLGLDTARAYLMNARSRHHGVDVRQHRR
jgi:hypothetical protein